MHQKALLCCLLFISPFLAISQIQPVGNWRDHLPYHQAIRVTSASNKIWAATPYSIFSVDLSDNSLERWSRISGLSETGISTIGTEDASGKIIIAYNNSNVDVLDNSSVNNIDAIKNSTTPGDKTIYDVFTFNQQAYLSTGIGIIVLDLVKYEVKNTYIIGNNGDRIKVNAVTVSNGFFYAATDEGIKRAATNAVNLADFRSWQLVSGSNGLPVGPVRSIAAFQNNVIALKNDSLYQLTGTNWSFFYTGNRAIKNFTVSGTRIVLSETQNSTGRITVLTAAGAIEKTIQDPKFTAAPMQSIIFQNDYWIADSLAGLSKYASSFESYVPGSPPSIATGGMHSLADNLWVAAGSVDENWQPVNNRNGVYRFFDNNWSYFNGTNSPALDTIADFITTATDPIDQSGWSGSYGGGLVNIKPGGNISIYKNNSPLQPAYFAPGSYRVSGLAFDADNNLWVSNYGANQEIHVRKTGGNWRSFTIPFPLIENAVAQLIVDDVNQEWIVSPKGNGLICFNHGESIDNPADDKWKWYRAGRGNGNLPDNNVLCVAKDRNNLIWVGTKQGVGVIQCPESVFTQQGCEAILPIVQQDNFAGYLFSDEQVQAIAVDGADRKWVGTKNGAWLISSDGAKTIYRFTESNSPLLSNDVKQIAIDGKTGEVFFGTANGICSFRSTATDGTIDNNPVLVFPNPVPPGYTGTIAIRGIANNAIVKITEMDGRMVYQARALGGQAIWNGKDYKGKTASSGVYLVLVSDDTGQAKMVTKIVFIKK